MQSEEEGIQQRKDNQDSVAFQRILLARRQGTPRSNVSTRLGGADDDTAQAAANAHAPHPIEEEQDRREAEHEEQWYDAHGLGDELHLPQEERARRDEEPEAHAPQMPRQSSRSPQAARANRTEVAHRREQNDSSYDQRRHDTRAADHFHRWIQPFGQAPVQARYGVSECEDHQRDVDRLTDSWQWLYCRHRREDQVSGDEPGEDLAGSVFVHADSRGREA